MKNNFLFLGPRKLKNEVNKTGGIVVLFEDLLRYCDENNINYIVVDTNKSNYTNKLVAYLSIIVQILRNINKVRVVSLHGTANDYLLIAPVALLISKFFYRPFSLRKFAGNFIEIYEDYSIFKQIIIKNTLKYSSYNYFETKYLVKYFTKFNQNTFWFPNVREKQNIVTSETYKKRFVFLGAVKPEKGINYLCEVSMLLDDDYIIDIYGTLDSSYTKEIFQSYKVNYNGSISPTDVPNILVQYDVLVLPTYWSGEGYPGVLIEAMSIGLPIIATNLDGIREMVTAEMSILIEPKNLLQLKNAMMFFNSSNYLNMSKKSLKQFEYFDTDIQTKLFFDRIENYA